MPITDQEFWDKCVKNNRDPCGGDCVAVARRVMEILDEEPGDFDCHTLIDRADNEILTGGITVFMASAAAQMISRCHSRGEEFRRQWDRRTQGLGSEGEMVNASGAVLSPAMIKSGDD